MRCAIWYHLHNLKNVKNTHEGVLILVQLQAATLLKLRLLHGCFSRFLNFTNGTKSRNHKYSKRLWICFNLLKKLLGKLHFLSSETENQIDSEKIN